MIPLETPDLNNHQPVAAQINNPSSKQIICLEHMNKLCLGLLKKCTTCKAYLQLPLYLAAGFLHLPLCNDWKKRHCLKSLNQMPFTEGKCEVILCMKWLQSRPLYHTVRIAEVNAVSLLGKRRLLSRDLWHLDCLLLPLFCISQLVPPSTENCLLNFATSSFDGFCQDEEAFIFSRKIAL